VLCQLPTLRTLRHLNAVATVATFVFAACTLALCIYDGEFCQMRTSYQAGCCPAIARKLHATVSSCVPPVHAGIVLPVQSCRSRFDADAVSVVSNGGVIMRHLVTRRNAGVIGQRLDRSKVTYNLDSSLTPLATVAQASCRCGQQPTV
jgi:hypothetical protein